MKVRLLFLLFVSLKSYFSLSAKFVFRACKRYVACCVRSVDVTNELLGSLILSKANYPVRLNVEISIGKNHRDIELQETNNIDIIHMTKSDYACVSV